MPLPVPPTFPILHPGEDYSIWAKTPGIDGNRLFVNLDFIYDGTTPASVSFARFEMYDEVNITVGYSLTFGLVDDFTVIAGLLNALPDFSALYFAQGSSGGSINADQGYDPAFTGQATFEVNTDTQYYSAKVGGFYNLARISSAHGYSVGG